MVTDSHEESRRMYKDMLTELAQGVNEKLEQTDQKLVKLEKEMQSGCEVQSAVQEEIKQLRERLESSQTCRTTSRNTAPDSSCTPLAAPSGQWNDVVLQVSRLTDCKLQDLDLADEEARKQKERNAVL